MSIRHSGASLCPYQMLICIPIALLRMVQKPRVNHTRCHGTRRQAIWSVSIDLQAISVLFAPHLLHRSLSALQASPRSCLQKTSSPARQSFKHNGKPPHLRHLVDEFLIKWFPIYRCTNHWAPLLLLPSMATTPHDGPSARSSLLFSIIIGGSLLLCNTFSRFDLA